MHLNKTTSGYLLAIIPAIFWGVSGTFCQYLFEQKQVSAEWLVTIRLLLAGAILLSIALVRKENIWLVWKNRRDAVILLVFSIAGMAAVQYTYFAAIYASNAATATVLQYLGPAMIAGYLAIHNRKIPALYEWIALICAISGTFLLVTHGSFRSLSISGIAFFLGMLAAIALAFYTLYPLKLLQRWPSTVIIGWGMFVGGVAFSFVQHPWEYTGQWDMTVFSMIAFIILFGSLFAFYAYLVSVQYIGAAKASLLACMEPLSATVFTVAWLKIPFGIADWIGTGLIMVTVVLLTLERKQKKPITK